MARIEETKLPGVGVRHDFITKMGTRIGVIAHRAGHRELLIYDEDDPDQCQETVRLDEEESHALADLLGETQVTATITELRQSVEGVTIDWLPVRAASACAEATIGDTELRQRTGVTIVAVVRGDETIASPGPDFSLAAGDTAVVVGTPDGIEQALTLLQGS
jgi:TrkA domain protein